MARKKRKPPVGARPGTLVVDTTLPPPRIHVVRYTDDTIDERDAADAGSLADVPASRERWWIDVQGLGDHATLEALAQIFSIHPLALEDVVNTTMRPKSEVYPHNMLLITRMLQTTADHEIDSEQVSLVLGPNYVITFQEHYGDVLDPVRSRLRAEGTRIRTAGPDYLAYAILDTIVDAYFPVIERVSDDIEGMEQQVMEEPTPATLNRLNRLKHRLLRIRRAVVPQREAVNAMVRDPSTFLGEDTRLFLRDTYDHCLVSAEAVETGRELLNGLMNTYLSVVSNRMNEVMKILTIVASIFVPLTFMAGVYGMNFDNMPELHWRWSYPVLLAAMVAVACGMVRYFRRRGWIGNADDSAVDERRER